jgi:hypothetical protein
MLGFMGSGLEECKAQLADRIPSYAWTDRFHRQFRATVCTCETVSADVLPTRTSPCAGHDTQRLHMEQDTHHDTGSVWQILTSSIDLSTSNAACSAWSDWQSGVHLPSH